MKHELVVYSFDIGMVMGLNLDRLKLSFFFFAKLSFGMNVKGQRNPS